MLLAELGRDLATYHRTPQPNSGGPLGDRSCLWSRAAPELCDEGIDADTGGPSWRSSSQLIYRILSGASLKHLYHSIWDGEKPALKHADQAGGNEGQKAAPEMKDMSMPCVIGSWEPVLAMLHA